MFFKEESNEIQIIPASQDSSEGVLSDERLIEALDRLNENLESINNTEEESTDELTEEITEEETEVPVEEQPVQKQDLYDLSQDIQDMSGNLRILSDYVQDLQASSEEEARREGETEAPSLQILAEMEMDEETSEERPVDHGADGHLYMAEQVENADLNDIYSMLWSTRNVVLLFMLLWLSVICFKLFRSAIERLFNR